MGDAAGEPAFDVFEPRSLRGVGAAQGSSDESDYGSSSSDGGAGAVAAVPSKQPPSKQKVSPEPKRRKQDPESKQKSMMKQSDKLPASLQAKGQEKHPFQLLLEEEANCRKVWFALRQKPSHDDVPQMKIEVLQVVNKHLRETVGPGADEVTFVSLSSAQKFGFLDAPTVEISEVLLKGGFSLFGEQAMLRRPSNFDKNSNMLHTPAVSETTDRRTAHRLFVAGLGGVPHISNPRLAVIFAAIGPVEAFERKLKPGTSKYRDIAFLQYRSPESAADAINILNGNTYALGRWSGTLEVRYAE